MEKGIQKGIQKGMQKGIEKGIEKGKKESLKEIILKQLKIKFENIPEKYHDKIKKLNEDELEKLTEEIITISNINELDKYIE